MSVNLEILIIIAVALVALVAFIIIRNIKDKDEFTKELNAEDDLPIMDADRENKL